LDILVQAFSNSLVDNGGLPLSIILNAAFCLGDDLVDLGALGVQISGNRCLLLGCWQAKNKVVQHRESHRSNCRFCATFINFQTKLIAYKVVKVPWNNIIKIVKTVNSLMNCILPKSMMKYLASSSTVPSH